MILKQQTEKIILQNGNSSYEFLKSGDIFRFTAGNILINQFYGNPLEGSANNIYLRLYEGGERKAYPLLGHGAKARVGLSQNKLVMWGNVKDIHYRVIFSAAPSGIWFWKVELNGMAEQADLLYGQDLGMADRNAVRTNELYMSQYLGHYIEKGNNGYVICSRQNQSQGGQFPYLQQGCLDTEIVSYSTDEMQFFGTEYRKTNIPKALGQDLEGRNYQFELSYASLQTEIFAVEGRKEIVFYGKFSEHHPDKVSSLEYQDEIRKAYEQTDWTTENIKEEEPIPVTPMLGKPFCSGEFTDEEITAYFPDRLLEEKDEEKLLSFFQEDHSHVVLQAKELLTERPHGNIITTLPDEKKLSPELLTSTNYMYGLFHAQVVVGNTDMNKMSSVNRGLLNILKNTGERIYIRLDGKYRILTLPAAYEMGVNYSRWYYKIEDDILEVTSYNAAHEPVTVLNVESKKDRSYEFLVTTQLSMGNTEFEEEIPMTQEPGRIIFTPPENSPMSQICPSLSYTISYPEKMFEISDDRILYEDEKTRNGTMLTMKAAGARIHIKISGSLAGEKEKEVPKPDFETERLKYLEFYHSFTNHFRVFGKEKDEELEKLNALTLWYTHNALVHFSVPHGLEQCSGAAWGTRDVCQGPMELFLLTNHFELARNVLLEIYSHQNQGEYEWPQWFMFDNYPYQAGDCHGDVVFWPLKCIGDYLDYTNDTSILDEKLPYRNKDGSVTSKKETLMEHILHGVETIRHRFIGDTSLISYAGGDWDDTLQPADSGMKDRMVSAWTQALAYQVLEKLAQQLITADPGFAKELKEMAQAIGEDFRKYLIKDDVTAGFCYFEEDGTITYLLHPEDEKTGISYRLLPLTRSIISGLCDKEEAEKNIELIREHLTFPDGIRLMDRPARYEGGVSIYFQRAEQASNVGREISLQYVHAHIRYIEAMCAHGNAEEAFDNLMKIVPVKIKDTVKNAGYRQSNVYFSSSEGAFFDRYQYQEEFERLKTGSIEAKGGWRIYSSGPGIFLPRWIGNIVGIRVKEHAIEIDPVLPIKLDGLRCTMNCFGKEITFIFHVNQEHTGLRKLESEGIELMFERLPSKYRTGGARLKREDFLSGIGESGQFHIYV